MKELMRNGNVWAVITFVLMSSLCSLIYGPIAGVFAGTAFAYCTSLFFTAKKE